MIYRAAIYHLNRQREDEKRTGPFSITQPKTQGAVAVGSSEELGAGAVITIISSQSFFGEKYKIA